MWLNAVGQAGPDVTLFDLTDSVLDLGEGVGLTVDLMTLPVGNRTYDDPLMPAALTFEHNVKFGAIGSWDPLAGFSADSYKAGDLTDGLAGFGLQLFVKTARAHRPR